MRVHVDPAVPAAAATRDAIRAAGMEVVADRAAADRTVGAAAGDSLVVAATADAAERALTGAQGGVIGAGLSPTLGVLLAAVVMEQSAPVDELHVTWHLPLGRRDRAADEWVVADAVLDAVAVSWWQGEPRRHRAAEHRRIAWFPQPVGVTHAVVVGLPEVPLLHAAHGVPTITGGVALSSWKAELVQAAARPGRVGRAVRSLLRGHVDVVTPRRRTQQRWAVVVEAVTKDGVARGWANGTDVLGSHAAVVAAVVGRAGLTECTSVVDLGARSVLDDLADAGTLRWAVRRP